MTTPRGWHDDTCSVMAAFCTDRMLGRLRTANVTLWRLFGYDACWQHLPRTFAAKYGLPDGTPLVTQRAFHRCHELDVRASWEDALNDRRIALRRYVRERDRLSSPSHANRDVERHCAATRVIHTSLESISWPNPGMSLGKYRSLCNRVVYNAMTLQDIKAEAVRREERVKTLQDIYLPWATARVSYAEEQCRKARVFMKFLTMLPLYELPDSVDALVFEGDGPLAVNV